MSRITWWPARGPIDLAQHDLPHPAADTEWWYVNSHVQLEDGRTFGLFAAFFRIISWKDAHFSFDSGLQPEDPTLRQPTMTLLFEGLRKLDESDRK